DAPSPHVPGRPDLVRQALDRGGQVLLRLLSLLSLLRDLGLLVLRGLDVLREVIERPATSAQGARERTEDVQGFQRGAPILLELLLRLLAGAADLLERALGLLELRFEEAPEVADAARHAVHCGGRLLGALGDVREVD